jgi:hypothetical protein
MEVEDIVRMRRQATPSEDIKDLVRAIVNCSVGGLAIALMLSVITSYKWRINPVTNPNPMSSH